MEEKSDLETVTDSNGSGMAFLTSATLLYVLLRRMHVAALVMLLFFGNSRRILGAKICRKFVVTGPSLVTRWITEECERKSVRIRASCGNGFFPSWRLFVCACGESWSLSLAIFMMVGEDSSRGCPESSLG